MSGPCVLRKFERTERNHARTTAGFTLIELLVVVGLIVLLVAGVGFSLGDTGGSALASAQNSLSSLCGTARAQAALHQTEARLLVYAAPPPTGDAEKYLRLLQVFRAEPAGSTNWIAASPAVFLPRGVYVVPGSTTGLVAAGVLWPANPPLTSTLREVAGPTQPAGTAFNGATKVLALEFAADGSVTTSAGANAIGRVVLATAAVANNLPQFNNPGAVRGLIVRATGALGFANDANGF